MRILVTGANGFIAKNLITELHNRGYHDVFAYHRQSDPSSLETYCRDAEYVFHLAGVNRPDDASEFQTGNVDLTQTLLDLLKKHKNACPVMLASSIQAERDNPYGRSKKAGEALLRSYGEASGAPVDIYRFPNVFGKWCKPNYNSVVATFCYYVAHDLPLRIDDPNAVLRLVYIDDVVDELIRALEGNATRTNGFCIVPVDHRIPLGVLADLIISFQKCRSQLCVPYLSHALTKKLYSTYLSYLPKDGFSYPLTMHEDTRGSFTEFLKSPDRGQVSINVSKPGIVKGNHWHHTKTEKFLVVSGEGVIRFRRLDDDEVLEYFVSGTKMEVVDIPPGYTHNIENLGSVDMVTVMWANERFDPENPDTFFLEV